MNRALAAIAVLVSLPAALASGCGGDGGTDGTGADFSSLVERLPDTSTIYAADVAAARSDLGLPSDADAIDVEAAFGSGIDQGDPLQRLVRDTGIAFPPLAQELGGSGPSGPLSALDGGAIEAVASTGPGEIQVSAIKTSQSFDSLADALAAQGYVRSGDVLAADGQTIGGIADAGDGVVVMARSEQQAADAIDQEPQASGPGDLVLRGDEPVRVAQTASGCLTGILAGQAADAASGSVLLESKTSADADALDLRALRSSAPGFEFSAPQASDSELSFDYSGDAPKLEVQTPVETLGQTLGVYSAYKCGP